MSTETRLSVPNRRSILRAPGQPPRVNSAVIQFQHDRNDYIVRVYGWAIGFISLSAFQWISIIQDHVLKAYFIRNSYISFLAAFSTLILLTFFALFNELRYNPSVNWIFAVCVVECATFGLLQTVLYSELLNLALCFMVTAVINFAFSIIAILIPLDITEYIVPLLVASFVVYLLMTFALLVVITAGVYIPRWFFSSVIMVLLVVYNMYNAQLISGTRTGVLRWRDYILPALMVYFTFTVMFVLLASSVVRESTLSFDDESKFEKDLPFLN